MPFRWSFHPEQPVLQERIARASSLSRLAARLLVNRGIRTAEEADDFLRSGVSALADPYAMSHMERAVERLLVALRQRETIVVYGDSDVDGVAGTALLAGFLRAIGARVLTYIPNRLVEGYSLTARGLEFIRQAGAAVVITVDNGTTAVERVGLLRAVGVDVIVCDHHEPQAELPAATALLNPKWSGCGYPFHELCGTAVAFQLLSGLATRLPARGRNHDAMCDLIRHSVAFVALATICDCVPLVGENRALARAGLAALRETDHPGLRALLAVSGVSREVQSDDVSFRLGPRINAAGRLGQADGALALLLADSRTEATRLARELEAQNGERQQLEAEVAAGARRQALASVDADDPILVLDDDTWHAGVVGIVAARLATEFHRPAVLVAVRDGKGRGSGRSVAGFDLYHALASCSDHLVGFGGHTYAAGFEVEPHRIPALREALREVARTRRDGIVARQIWIDAEVPLGVLTPSLMFEINRLSPFGEGLAAPVFASPRLMVEGPPRVVGKNQNHLSFMVLQDGVRRKAIGYGLGHQADRLRGGAFSLAFVPRLNLFRGQASVELDVRDIRYVEGC